MADERMMNPDRPCFEKTGARLKKKEGQTTNQHEIVKKNGTKQGGGHSGR